MMRRFLLLPMLCFETVLLGVAWCLVRVHPETAARLIDWAVDTLPGREWYSSEQGEE